MITRSRRGASEGGGGVVGGGGGGGGGGVVGGLPHRLVVSRAKLVREKLFDNRPGAVTGVVNNAGLDLDLLVVVVDHKGVPVLWGDIGLPSYRILSLLTFF